MTIPEAIGCRHSVRHYQERALTADIIEKINNRIGDINRRGKLHVQLVTDEARAFKGIFAYGKFSGVTNYIIMAGARTDDLDLRIGYYGEELVLYAQTLGLNTCWAGLSYHKVGGTYSLEKDEKIVCYIAIGYGVTQGTAHKTKTIEQLGGVDDDSPQWYRRGVEAARLAPSAINQQKYRFRCLGTDADGNGLVECDRGFSLVGYTSIDLGIAQFHFEVGAQPVGVTFR